ncbi:MAG: 4-(cytidine 5'-diphospho)-2-C-methyl-D-erythritol kinase [Oscillospiraceae bacterium]|jgi:4-diphosphocytidyl-2-C-methyl-D-erythritol kinase|nr:4-(cytidine 5'-diphospho)-2-C-methyl-D-erythritol kinase [Oscillospiraceae bacterium]
MIVTKYAAAKINLLLDITAKLENGYHSIYSIMQSVSLYDKITVSKNNTSKIALSCSSPLVTLTDKNTAHKAAALFFARTGRQNQGVNIHIEKHIPMQGGLAGGSADAAGVLAALNDLFGADLSKQELCALGIKIGADVPFCLRGGTMLAQNIGDVLSPLPSLPDCRILLVKPHSGVSTVEAYRAYDEKEWIRHPNKEYALHAAVNQDLHAFCRYSGNVFEQAVEVVERVEIKSCMRSFGALDTFMTGSGSVICAIFEAEDEEYAARCMDELKKTYPQTFLTSPVKQGVCEKLEKDV